MIETVVSIVETAASSGEGAAVELLSMSYAEWLACALAAVPVADHPAIFGGNARRFYGLTS